MTRAAIESAATDEGVKLDSIILEFVSDAGDVVRTARFGAPAGAAPGQQGSQGLQGSSGPQDMGHRPIGGLADTRGAGQTRAPTPQGAVEATPSIRNIIAVGAGKGGVGKSTIALNLAVGLARRGASVGLMDGDIYGPSLPTLLGLGAMEPIVVDGKLQPFLVHGVKSMTIGKLVDPDKPLIWRGPMAHGAFKQLAEQTNWGELDYLIIDLPPGTGDVALTMAQMLKLSGAVVVCTPQKVAQDDAVRAAKMFQQLGIEVLGVVENMSFFIGDDGKEYDIFGKGGAEFMAQRLNVPFLGAVPLTMGLRKNSDDGNPTANFAGGAITRAFEELISRVEGQLNLTAMKKGRGPTLTIS
ncbi:MAG: Mrp/NBP35 family ATP-binding protein [Phycisphaerales bacterium]|nr:Mrp/NBP35 family ATP-binding protein [Phycisphaerales bacterium]